MSHWDGYGYYPASGSPDPYGRPPAQETGDPDPYAGEAEYVHHRAEPGAQPHAAPPANPYAGLAAYPYAAPPSSSTSTAALVLGILSITCLPLLGPVGLFLATKGMRETEHHRMSGRGMAIAGLVLSILGTLYLLFVAAYFVFLFVMIGFSATQGY